MPATRADNSMSCPVVAAASSTTNGRRAEPINALNCIISARICRSRVKRSSTTRLGVCDNVALDFKTRTTSVSPIDSNARRLKIETGRNGSCARSSMAEAGSAPCFLYHRANAGQPLQ